MAGENFAIEADAAREIADASHGAGQIELAAIIGHGVMPLERQPQVAKRLVGKQPPRARHHRLVGQLDSLARLALEEQPPNIAYLRHRLDVDRVARPSRTERFLVELNTLA